MDEAFFLGIFFFFSLRVLSQPQLVLKARRSLSAQRGRERSADENRGAFLMTQHQNNVSGEG